MPDWTRAERRKFNRDRFRELGYSAKQADAWRDRSPQKQDAEINRLQRSITRKPIVRRTPRERERLNAIRDFRSKYTPPPAPRQFKDRPSPLIGRESSARRKERRREQFSRWSRRSVGFPDSELRKIARINDNAGLDPLNSFGFRVYYHQYVNDETPFRAIRRAESRDT